MFCPHLCQSKVLWRHWRSQPCLASIFVSGFCSALMSCLGYCIVCFWALLHTRLIILGGKLVCQPTSRYSWVTYLGGILRYFGAFPDISGRFRAFRGHLGGILGQFGIGAFWGIARRWDPRGRHPPVPQNPPPISISLLHTHPVVLLCRGSARTYLRT